MELRGAAPEAGKGLPDLGGQASPLETPGKVGHQNEKSKTMTKRNASSGARKQCQAGPAPWAISTRLTHWNRWVSSWGSGNNPSRPPEARTDQLAGMGPAQLCSDRTTVSHHGRLSRGQQLAHPLNGGLCSCLVVPGPLWVSPRGSPSVGLPKRIPDCSAWSKPEASSPCLSCVTQCSTQVPWLFRPSACTGSLCPI